MAIDPQSDQFANQFADARSPVDDESPAAARRREINSEQETQNRTAGKNSLANRDSMCLQERSGAVLRDWFYGGRCRIRTCDFHRVKVALYR